MVKFFVAFLALIWLSPTAGQCAPRASVVRPPAVAGSFYPSDSVELRQLVARQLAAAPAPRIDGDLIALVVPHAGLEYSGPVAAFAYRLLANRPVSKVILCGPSHRVGFTGLSVYGPGITWRTPLGEVRSNDSLCEKFVRTSSRVTTSGEPQLQEHSLEVQLPYLQTVLRNFEIVPVLMGYQDKPTIDALAKILKDLPFDSTTIMLASTDWQHYRPASEGHLLDSIGISYLERLDPDGLASCFDAQKSEACGAGPLIAVLKAAIARGANRVRILRVGDSGDITGDKSSVVGYVAAALYRSNTTDQQLQETSAGGEAPADEPGTAELSVSDQRRLLEIARQSIEADLTGKPIPKFAVSDVLKQIGAAFVTLTENGQLRGCIGTVVAREPLYLAVSHCAVSAATEDPRFTPVAASEIPQLTLEISVITPMVKVTNLDEIRVGRDGLMIRMGNHSGLLLPQVATEYGWNRTTFLEQTCAKAGLPENSYLSSDATIYKFQAFVFGEESMPTKPK